MPTAVEVDGTQIWLHHSQLLHQETARILATSGLTREIPSLGSTRPATQRWICCRLQRTPLFRGDPVKPEPTAPGTFTFIFLLVLSFLGIFSFTFTSFFLLCILKFFLGTFFLFLSFLFLSLFLLLSLLFSFSFRRGFILSFLGFCSLSGLLHLDLLLLDVADCFSLQGLSTEQLLARTTMVKRLLYHSSAFCMFLAASFSCWVRMSLSIVERSDLENTSISMEI
ncbi:hypothetical protein QTO34_000604 [Cnephaeus nilssonii]|uniref:Uncharacterized protein n=1 Tax=Cnephaeus nilssonii TaxID=3371016 RepID=A0AA40IBR2_CNENI|nr:hypothetical protein QTO34_000604 [Eptesicus nilssonii]